MNIWFTSDNHYYHKNICRFSGRPFSSVEEMNEKLIEFHNAVVSPKDTVWFLGDFAFCNAAEIKQLLLRLNGQKHLVLGNHDKQIENSRQTFIGDSLFRTIQTRKHLNYNNQAITLDHYGGRVWNKSHHGSWQLYGHSHGHLPPQGKSVDVGVDSPYVTGKPEYRPYSFKEIKTFMDKQESPRDLKYERND